MGNQENSQTTLANGHLHKMEELGTTITAKSTTSSSSRPFSQLVRYHSISLERKSNIRRTLGFIIAYLIMETMKQMSNYGLSAAHGGKYPLPSTLLVLLTEVTKLFIVIIYAASSRAEVGKWRPCVKLAAPAACYFCTNLLYLVSLPYTSPPIWMVLIQTRTLYTAIAYLCVFGRELKPAQMVGCLLVVGSLPVARFSEMYAGRDTLTSPVILASQVAAFLSTVASIVVELLLKNDHRSVVEQQAWLYVWGSLLAGVSLAIHTDLSALANLHLETWSLLYVVAAVGTSALAGLCVPFIVRNLDTIAKDYLAALNNTMLSVMTAIFFPLAFTLNHLYLLSLAILLYGIWLYEKKHFPCCPPSKQSSSPSSVSPPPPPLQPPGAYGEVDNVEESLPLV